MTDPYPFRSLPLWRNEPNRSVLVVAPAKLRNPLGTSDDETEGQVNDDSEDDDSQCQTVNMEQHRNAAHIGN